MANPIKWLQRFDIGMTLDVVMALAAFAILGIAFVVSGDLPARDRRSAVFGGAARDASARVPRAGHRHAAAGSPP